MRKTLAALAASLVATTASADETWTFTGVILDDGGVFSTIPSGTSCLMSIDVPMPAVPGPFAGEYILPNASFVAGGYSASDPEATASISTNAVSIEFSGNDASLGSLEFADFPGEFGDVSAVRIEFTEPAVPLASADFPFDLDLGNWNSVRIFVIVPGATSPNGDINTLTKEPANCLADVNGDGLLSPTDFTAWINAFNNNLPECDQNGDNACTPTDFTAWIANFNAGC